MKATTPIRLRCARRSPCSARPRSARAAGASRCSAICWNSARAVPICTANCASRCWPSGVDLVFCCGPLMRALWEALPSERRGGYAENSAALESQLLAAIRPGDAVMVKGSLGSRMGLLVKATGAPLGARRNAGGARPTFNRYRLIHALLAFRILRHVRSPQRPALHHLPHRRSR